MDPFGLRPGRVHREVRLRAGAAARCRLRARPMNADPPANLEFFLALTLAPDTAWVIVQRELEATGVNPSS
jgi:hypothetical protein